MIPFGKSRTTFVPSSSRLPVKPIYFIVFESVTSSRCLLRSTGILK